jgi:hypothetical protein
MRRPKQRRRPVLLWSCLPPVQRQPARVQALEKAQAQLWPPGSVRATGPARAQLWGQVLARPVRVQGQA